MTGPKASVAMLIIFGVVLISAQLGSPSSQPEPVGREQQFWPARRPGEQRGTPGSRHVKPGPESLTHTSSFDDYDDDDDTFEHKKRRRYRRQSPFLNPFQREPEFEPYRPDDDDGGGHHAYVFRTPGDEFLARLAQFKEARQSNSQQLHSDTHRDGKDAGSTHVTHQLGDEVYHEQSPSITQDVDDDLHQLLPENPPEETGGEPQHDHHGGFGGHHHHRGDGYLYYVIDVNGKEGGSYEVHHKWNVDCNNYDFDYKSGFLVGIWDDKDDFEDLDKVKCAGPMDSYKGVKLDFAHQKRIELSPKSNAYTPVCPRGFVLTALWDDHYGFRHVIYGKCIKVAYGEVNNDHCNNFYTKYKDGGPYDPYTKWHVQCPKDWAAIGVRRDYHRVDHLRCCKLTYPVHH